MDATKDNPWRITPKVVRKRTHARNLSSSSNKTDDDSISDQGSFESNNSYEIAKIEPKVVKRKRSTSRQRHQRAKSDGVPRKRRSSIKKSRKHAKNKQRVNSVQSKEQLKRERRKSEREVKRRLRRSNTLSDSFNILPQLPTGGSKGKKDKRCMSKKRLRRSTDKRQKKETERHLSKIKSRSDSDVHGKAQTELQKRIELLKARITGQPEFRRRKKEQMELAKNIELLKARMTRPNDTPEQRARVEQAIKTLHETLAATR